MLSINKNRKLLKLNESSKKSNKIPASIKINSHMRLNKKHGTSSFVKSHTRQMMILEDGKNNIISQVKDNSLDGSIVQKNALTKNKGVNSNYQIKIKNTQTKDAYFKPINGEQFTENLSGEFGGNTALIRNGIVLHERKTEHTPKISEYKKISQLSTQQNLKQYKGQMIARELTSAFIGKELGIPQPNVNILEIDGDIGFVSQDAGQSHNNKNTSIIHNVNDGSGRRKYNFFDKPSEVNVAQIKKTDKNIGNIGTFDFLIGNVDRHLGNFLVASHSDNSKTAIAFDHGLTFTSDHNELKNFYSNKKENGNKHIGLDVQPTKEFISNLQKLQSSDKFNSLISHIKNNIGEKEAMKFIERLDIINKNIRNNDDLSLRGLIDKL